MKLYSAITDQQWAMIEPLLPGARAGGNKRTIDLRLVVDGLLYRLTTTTCRDRANAPQHLPVRTTLNDYHRRWTRDGTLNQILETLGLVIAIKSIPARAGAMHFEQVISSGSITPRTQP